MDSEQSSILAEITQLETELIRARKTMSELKQAKLAFGVVILITPLGGLLYVVLGDPSLDTLNTLSGLLAIPGGVAILVFFALDWRERIIKRRVIKNMQLLAGAKLRLIDLLRLPR